MLHGVLVVNFWVLRLSGLLQRSQVRQVFSFNLQCAVHDDVAPYEVPGGVAAGPANSRATAAVNLIFQHALTCTYWAYVAVRWERCIHSRCSAALHEGGSMQCRTA
jgi:hypothetical protein